MLIKEVKLSEDSEEVIIKIKQEKKISLEAPPIEQLSGKLCWYADFLAEIDVSDLQDWEKCFHEMIILNCKKILKLEGEI